MFGPVPDLASSYSGRVERRTALVLRDENGAVAGGLLLGGAGKVRRVDWLAVRPESRGRGIGGMLVREAIRRVDPPSIVSVVTFGPDVAGGLAARRLDERLGFLACQMVEDGPEGGARQLS